MSVTTILHGPCRSGKSAMSRRVARELGLVVIVDLWHGKQLPPRGVLAVRSVPGPYGPLEDIPTLDIYDVPNFLAAREAQRALAAIDAACIR